MSKPAKGLDQLSQELSETVNRIDQLQKKPPLRQRISRHFSKQGSNIVGVVLAGTLFSVALDRLAQKRSYESEREEWQQQQKALENANTRLEENLGRARQEKQHIQSIISEELDRKGWWLAPLSRRIRQGLEEASTAASPAKPQRKENSLAPDLKSEERAKTRPKLMI